MDDKVIALALYTINKYAKISRLARDLLKDILFKDITDIVTADDDYITEFADRIVEKAGFMNVSEILDGLKAYQAKSIHEYEKKNPIDDPLIHYGINFNDDVEDDDDEFMNDVVFIEDIIKGYELSDKDIDEYKDYFDEKSVLKLREIAEEQSKIYDFYTKVDKLHDLLKETAHISQNLYSLKEATIKKLNLLPIAYHINNDPDNMLILYSYAGFSFHLPISRLEVDGTNIDINTLKKIDQISPEIKISSNEQLALEDAIKTLLAVIKLDVGNMDSILFGKFDFCEKLGIKKNTIQRPLKEVDYEGWDINFEDDDYEDDDEDYYG